jgi:hypothetical protein
MVVPNESRSIMSATETIADARIRNDPDPKTKP